MTARTELEHRPEQFMFDKIIRAVFADKILHAKQEMVFFVSHPEWAPKGFETRVDNYFMIKGADSTRLSLCFDLNGSWHTKEKVQNWDFSKKLCLEHCGHYYIAINGHDQDESCITLWQLTDYDKEFRMADEAGKIEANDISRFMDLFDKAKNEILYETLSQIANSGIKIKK